ncbi:hypothetical protein GX586_02320 [bacterium]|nr:hypothetical protein [bacterium]
MNEEQTKRQRFPLGAWVRHPVHGRGRIVDYEGETYVTVFGNGVVQRIPSTFEGLALVESRDDEETSRLKRAVEEVLGDHGWIDVHLEMSPRWVGGMLVLTPGRQGTQSKEVPIEGFFKKLIGVREKLRVLEQKINNHPALSAEEKLELEGYLTRCYGSLTTFNVLFAEKESQFTGQVAD